MKFKHSLRIRITVTFFLFGTLLMVAVATGVNLAIEDIEETVIKKNAQKELHNFQQRYRSDPQQVLPHSASMTSYLVGPEEDFKLPVYMRGLKHGTYLIKNNNKILQIIIDKVNGKKIALELDITLFEKRETSITRALIIAVISASVLSLWLGYALSQKAIAPVISLAKAVTKLEPDKPAEVLSTQYVDDEVGELAKVFDHHLERLQDFIAREQEFTANASHELRTPLTVIKGAVEILSADSNLSAHSQQVLQRIKRATMDMSLMVETLLVLAHEDEITEEDVSKTSVVAQTIITDSTHLLKDKKINLNIENKQDFVIRAPYSILAIFIGNILRNAIAYTKEGDITITVESPFVRVTDTGKGISSEDLPFIFDRHYRASDTGSVGSGLGLAIVKRICDRYGWLIDVNSSSGKGTVVSVDFSTSAKHLT